MSNSFRLDDLADVLSGVAIERQGDDAHAVMVGDLKGDGQLPVDLTVVGPPKAGMDARLQPGDIVISLRGNANFCAPVTAAVVECQPLFATLDLAVIRLRKHAPISVDYLVSYINLPSTQEQLSGHRSGTAALRLSLGPLKDLSIPVPSLDRQAAIAALSACAIEERTLNARLTALRTEMINELLRQAAAEGPALGMTPKQASTGPNGPGTTGRALSTRAER